MSSTGNSPRHATGLQEPPFSLWGTLTGNQDPRHGLGPLEDFRSDALPTPSHRHSRLLTGGVAGVSALALVVVGGSITERNGIDVPTEVVRVAFTGAGEHTVGSGPESEVTHGTTWEEIGHWAVDNADGQNDRLNPDDSVPFDDDTWDVPPIRGGSTTEGIEYCVELTKEGECIAVMRVQAQNGSATPN